MIRQVDEDHENKINFKGVCIHMIYSIYFKSKKYNFFPFLKFLTIFRKANNGELKQESGLQQLFQSVSLEIDVAETGVKGAKDFFEAQVILLAL